MHWPAVPPDLRGPARGDMEGYLRGVGGIFASFLLQDSGCRSYGLEVAGQRWFVKASATLGAVATLRRAVALHAAVAHPAIIPLSATVATDDGLALVYPWIDGEVLYGAPLAGAATRLDPAGAHARFRALPLHVVLAAVDAVLDAHLALAAAGFVAVDLYDGCFIYDFAGGRMWLCDLDEYRPGPFAVEEDRLPGSARFMAPEELTRGATVDERTTVFALGRTALVLLDEGEVGTRFRCSPAAAAVLEQATRVAPGDRYPTVAGFVSAWRRAVAPG